MTTETPDDLNVIPIARDGLAIIVNPQNTITNVTSLQLRALYRGETLDWGAVGGSGGEPVVISREDGSGSRTAFEALAMDGERVTLNALVMPTSQAVVDYVASHRNAVGYVSTGVLTDTVRAVPVEDIPPTAATVRSGEYRLGRVLYLYAPQPAAPGSPGVSRLCAEPGGTGDREPTSGAGALSHVLCGLCWRAEFALPNLQVCAAYGRVAFILKRCD